MSLEYESRYDSQYRDQFALLNLHNLQNSQHKPRMPWDKTKSTNEKYAIIRLSEREILQKKLTIKIIRKNVYNFDRNIFSIFVQNHNFSLKIWNFDLVHFSVDFRSFMTDSNLKKSLEADLVDLRSTVTQLIRIQSATIKIEIHLMIHFW